MHLPEPRGPLSSWVITTLSDDSLLLPAPPAAPIASPLVDDDLHLALWVCYELSFQGFDDVDDEAEWNVDVLTFRAGLETVFVRALRAALAPATGRTRPVADRLKTEIEADTGRSVASRIQRSADHGQFREFVMHRSIYHLKEADPHTAAIPHLRGRAKAAMVEIQADEYGGGRYESMHSTLFADLMTSLDLDVTYGRYLEVVPGVTLATNNLMSLFGLHRRWRGAAAGHLASIEMTSSLPNRRYGQGLRRLGGAESACVFFDEHVEADAVHEQIAAHDLCGALAADEPALTEDIVFGARAALLLDGLFAEHVLGAWDSGSTSLREPLVAASPVPVPAASPVPVAVRVAA